MSTKRLAEKISGSGDEFIILDGKMDDFATTV